MHMIFKSKYLLSFHPPNLGVEKKNDGFRRYFHRKVNCWDAATNLILRKETRWAERKTGLQEKSTWILAGGRKTWSSKESPWRKTCHQDLRSILRCYKNWRFKNCLTLSREQAKLCLERPEIQNLFKGCFKTSVSIHRQQ